MRRARPLLLPHLTNHTTPTGMHEPMVISRACWYSSSSVVNLSGYRIASSSAMALCSRLSSIKKAALVQRRARWRHSSHSTLCVSTPLSTPDHSVPLNRHPHVPVFVGLCQDKKRALKMHGAWNLRLVLRRGSLLKRSSAYASGFSFPPFMVRMLSCASFLRRWLWWWLFTAHKREVGAADAGRQQGAGAAVGWSAWATLHPVLWHVREPVQRLEVQVGGVEVDPGAIHVSDFPTARVTPADGKPVVREGTSADTVMQWVGHAVDHSNAAYLKKSWMTSMAHHTKMVLLPVGSLGISAMGLVRCSTLLNTSCAPGRSLGVGRWVSLGCGHSRRQGAGAMSVLGRRAHTCLKPTRCLCTKLERTPRRVCTRPAETCTGTAPGLHRGVCRCWWTGRGVPGPQIPGARGGRPLTCCSPGPLAQGTGTAGC